VAARDVLLDAGPIVAALDPGDQWHHPVVQAWETLIARCVTTEAVVTEACHLMLRGRQPAALPLELLLAIGIPVLSLDPATHRQAAVLMRRFANMPMDYADASLVALADALEIEQVFTTDRRGFGTYRGARGTAFEMLPA